MSQATHEERVAVSKMSNAWAGASVLAPVHPVVIRTSLQSFVGPGRALGHVRHGGDSRKVAHHIGLTGRRFDHGSAVERHRRSSDSDCRQEQSTDNRDDFVFRVAYLSLFAERQERRGAIGFESILDAFVEEWLDLRRVFSLQAADFRQPDFLLRVVEFGIPSALVHSR